MKTGLAAIGISLAAALAVVLTSASRELQLARHWGAGTAAPALSGSPRPAPDALPGPPQDGAPSQPQTGMPLARSEPVSFEAPDAAVDPVPAVQPPYERAAALDQLVEQSRQENEQLGQIHHQLTALRQEATDQETQREGEAEQAAADHAATLEALNTLRQLEARLETGDSDGVDEELVRAEAALSGRTLLDVEAAREALARSDLLPARQYLAAALAERRVTR